jgi:hypothetical protein
MRSIDCLQTAFQLYATGRRQTASSHITPFSVGGATPGSVLRLLRHSPYLGIVRKRLFLFRFERATKARRVLVFCMQLKKHDLLVTCDAWPFASRARPNQLAANVRGTADRASPQPRLRADFRACSAASCPSGCLRRGAAGESMGSERTQGRQEGESTNPKAREAQKPLAVSNRGPHEPLSIDTGTTERHDLAGVVRQQQAVLRHTRLRGICLRT